MQRRRAFLQSIGTIALAACDARSCLDRGPRRVFSSQTLYHWDRGELRALTRVGETYYGIEVASPSSYELCRYDLALGTRERILALGDVRADMLAVTGKSAYFVVVQNTGAHELYRASLTPDAVATVVFGVPRAARSLAADDTGLYTFRGDSTLANELVHVSDDGTVTPVARAEPGTLTASPRGVYYDAEDGLVFASRDGEKKRVSERGSKIILEGDAPLCCVGNKIYELDVNSVTRGRLLVDASTVTGAPCAALFGGYLLRVSGSAVGSFSRSGQASTGLNFVEAGRRGWTTALATSAGPHVFGAPHKGGYLQVTPAIARLIA